MITITSGHIQNSNGLAIARGSISFQLNLDATVVASPGGLIPAEPLVIFQFDSSGDLIQPAQIYSNAELNPQNASGLGTYYLVTIYDANNAPLNSSPMYWQFTEPANSTVDISTMTAYFTGGTVIYYPTVSSGGGGTPGAPSGSIQANNSGVFAGVLGSSVNFSTGAVSLVSLALTDALSFNADTGVSRGGAGILDVGNGSAGDASGTVNAAQYDVAGSQIAASNLANGTTGTGAIVLAASPALTGAPTAPTAAPSTNTTQIATTAFVIANSSTLPFTTLGDTLYENATPAPARLAGNTTTTKKYLSQTGTGTISAAPAWTQIAAADLSNGTTGTGAIVLANAPTFTANPVFASSTGSGAVVLAGSPTFTGTVTAATLSLSAQFLDGSASAGTSGYLLSSTGSATQWIPAPSGTPVFSAITTGTNTAATMTVGTGATLTSSGSGVINATELGGATFAAPGAIGGGTPAAGTFTTLTANTSLVVNGGTALTTTNQTGTGSLVLAGSPALTGVPTAVTASPGDNTTQIATDAFVQTAVSGAIAGVDALEVNGITVVSPFSVSYLVNGVGPVGETEVGGTLVINGLFGAGVPAFSDEFFSPGADPAPPIGTNNDEFNGTTLSGAWTAVNSAKLSAPTIFNSSFQVTVATPANSINGYVKSFSPGSNNFTFETKMLLSNLVSSTGGGTAGFPLAGLIISDGTKYLTAMMGLTNTVVVTVHIELWTNSTTYSSGTTANVTTPVFTAIVNSGFPYLLPVWIRLQKSSTNLILSYSFNGYDFAILTASAVFSSLGTITTVGIGTANNNGAAITPRWFYFRQIA